VQSYLDALALIVEDPASNLTAAVLLLAAVFLVLLILVLIALIGITSSSRQERTTGDAHDDDAIPGTDRDVTERKDKRLRPALLRSVSSPARIALAVAAFAVAGAATYTWSGTNEYCSAACHVMEPAASSWRLSPHSEVDCVRCHEGTPITSMPQAVMSRARHLLGSVTGASPGSVTLPPDRCLGCHEEEIAESIESTAGIRMDHSAPVDAGIPCESCHRETGHMIETAQASRMQVCLRCHDGDGASNECATCHIGDPGAHTVSARIFVQVQLPPPTCGGCHDESTCDACHGLRMPHSVEFLAGDHARPAAFDGRTLCWRCHVEADCTGGCHGSFDAGHGPYFKEDHKRYPWDSQCGTCHKAHEGSFCDRCH